MKFVVLVLLAVTACSAKPDDVSNSNKNPFSALLNFGHSSSSSSSSAGAANIATQNGGESSGLLSDLLQISRASSKAEASSASLLQQNATQNGGLFGLLNFASSNADANSTGLLRFGGK